MTIDGEQKVGACWECGYSLRGLTVPRCPECGRGFDPMDPTTMNMGIKVGPVKRWLMRPPGWPLYLLTAGAALVSLWAATAPTAPGAFVDLFGDIDYWRQFIRDASPEGRFVWGAFLWIILLTFWTVRRFARGATVSFLSRQKPATFAYWQRWLWPLVIFAATVICCMSPLPISAGFWLSRPALSTAANEKADANGGRKWIGIYPISERQTHVISVRIGQTWIFVSERGGFVHCDPGATPDERVVLPEWLYGRIRFKKLAEGWFSFRMINGFGE